jgi:hypothetical protein
MTDFSLTQSIAGQFAEAQDGDLQGEIMLKSKPARRVPKSTHTPAHRGKWLQIAGCDLAERYPLSHGQVADVMAYLQKTDPDSRCDWAGRLGNANTIVCAWMAACLQGVGGEPPEPRDNGSGGAYLLYSAALISHLIAALETDEGETLDAAERRGQHTLLQVIDETLEAVTRGMAH